jgi:transcriptional regulator with XRE-family HTH domain
MKLYDYMLLLREQHELSQVEFAKKIGVSKTYYSDIEHDRRNLSIKKAIIIAKKLNLSPLEFIELILQDHIYREGLNYEVKLMEHKR